MGRKTSREPQGSHHDTVVGHRRLFPSVPSRFPEPSWEFQADGLAIMLLLFGVVYRYAAREDTNLMLKQGVVGAFVVTRSWALITPPATCASCR